MGLALPIPNHRLLSQWITGANPAAPEAVVQWMGAVQAQDYGQALWAVGLRAGMANRDEVEQSIRDGKILLTWPMRGTVHMVPAADAAWMVSLLAPRILAWGRKRLEQLELTASIIDRSEHLIHDALSGHRRLARNEILALLEADGIATGGQRGYHLLWHLAQSGHICFGPREGKQQTFVLLHEWAPSAQAERPAEEALALLAKRYFASHGPATAQDFAWWSGLTLTEARRGAAAAADGNEVQHATVDGVTYWFGASPSAGQSASTQPAPVGASTSAAPGFAAPAAPASAKSASGPSVHLLPGFDEYLLGYKDRSAVLPAEYAGRVVPGNNGVFMPIVVVDGQVAGLWKAAAKKQGMEMHIRLFAPTEAAQADIAEAAQRYCTFQGLPMLDLEIAVKSETADS